MKPTNDERREVAARLRRLSGHREVDKEFVHEALGLYMGECVDGYDPVSVSELADLIEPEPERTCRVVTDKNAVSQTQEVHTKYCSRCSYVFGREQHRQLLPGLDEEIVLHAVQIPDYCPGCGAKVVEVGQ